MVVIFSYITIYVARTRVDEFGPIAEIPVNLLVLMGISGFSLIASKGISAYQISGGSLAVRKTSPAGNSIKYLIGDERGTPVLNKLQKVTSSLCQSRADIGE
jgi:hypothetical protein